AHARGLVNEPRAQMPGGSVGIFALVRQLVRRRQCGHDLTEANHRAAMLHEVIGIAHAVALDVGTVGILGIGPPVVALAEEVVLPARTARAGRGSNRDWFRCQVLIRGLEHAGTLDRRQVELGLAVEQRGSERELQKAAAVHVYLLGGSGRNIRFRYWTTL